MPLTGAVVRFKQYSNTRSGGHQYKEYCRVVATADTTICIVSLFVLRSLGWQSSRLASVLMQEYRHMKAEEAAKLEGKAAH